jgi:ribosome production factor 1
MKIPKTIENQRITDETHIFDINDDELQIDLENDEISANLNKIKSTDPKILVITNDMKISFKTYKFCRELCKILPNAQYYYRKNLTLTRIIEEAKRREYSAIMSINEDRKEPSKVFSVAKQQNTRSALV